jgi:hypothetical protein
MSVWRRVGVQGYGRMGEEECGSRGMGRGMGLYWRGAVLAVLLYCTDILCCTVMLCRYTVLYCYAVQIYCAVLLCCTDSSIWEQLP